MSYHFGTVINGDPVVCGGYDGAINNVECFLYERITKNWKRVMVLLFILKIKLYHL